MAYMQMLLVSSGDRIERRLISMRKSAETSVTPGTSDKSHPSYVSSFN
jgi:hypothetical protein